MNNPVQLILLTDEDLYPQQVQHDDVFNQAVQSGLRLPVRQHFGASRQRRRDLREVLFES